MRWVLVGTMALVLWTAPVGSAGCVVDLADAEAAALGELGTRMQAWAEDSVTAQAADTGALLTHDGAAVSQAAADIAAASGDFAGAQQGAVHSTLTQESARWGAMPLRVVEAVGGGYLLVPGDAIIASAEAAGGLAETSAEGTMRLAAQSVDGTAELGISAVDASGAYLRASVDRVIFTGYCTCDPEPTPVMDAAVEFLVCVA